MFETLFKSVYAWAYFSIGPMILAYFGISALIEYRRSSSFIKDLQEIMDTVPSIKDQLTTWLGYSVAGLIIFLAWPVFVIWAGRQKWKDRQDQVEDRKPKFYCTKQYLIKEVTTEEAEKDSYIIDPFGMTPKVPFGHMNKAWCTFLSELEDSDELWLYKIHEGSTTGKSYITAKAIMKGYAIVRRNEIVAEFVTQSN